MTHGLWPLLLMVGILSAVWANAWSSHTAIWFEPQSDSSSHSVFQSWFKPFLSGVQPTVPSSFHIKHSSSLHKNSLPKYVSFPTAHLAPFFYCKLVCLLHLLGSPGQCWKAVACFWCGPGCVLTHHLSLEYWLCLVPRVFSITAISGSSPLLNA